MWQPMELPYTELPGLSARLLKEHHRLYLGYLKRWDRAYHRVRDWTEKDGDAFDFGNVLAEENYLRNAVRLHELYFDQLVPGGRGSPERFFGDAGSAEYHLEWMRRAAKSTAGWVVLAMDLWRGELFVFPMRDHITGFPAGAWPLLVLDLYEHSFARDYGIAKDEYVDAFLRNVDWGTVENRSKEALSIETQAPAFEPA